ncbi:aminotransferase class IV [Bosea sp. NPDC055332]
MFRTVYTNGKWLPEASASVSIFDRGFLFGDAVYEVTAVAAGKLLDFDGHFARLQNSLAKLEIPSTVDRNGLLALHREIVKRNGLTEGLVYLQISRGVQDRSFIFDTTLDPTIVIFTQSKSVLNNPRWDCGIAVRSAVEGRWNKRDIKSVQLLFSSIAKVQANRDGFDDVVFVEDGLITETSSANFHIVTDGGSLVTRELSRALLPGITRSSIVELARAAQIRVEERAFDLIETAEAAEAFITDSVNLVMPVVSIDGHKIGAGMPGPVTRRLRGLYLEDRLARGIDVIA